MGFETFRFLTVTEKATRRRVRVPSSLVIDVDETDGAARLLLHRLPPLAVVESAETVGAALATLTVGPKERGGG
ncbi:MAG: hypothetical protein AAF360_07050 [Pseudomonadota bacterium]